MTLLRIEPAPHVPALISTSEQLDFDEFWGIVADAVHDHRQTRLASTRFMPLFAVEHDLIFEIIATLRLGAAACPINPDWPTERVMDALRVLGSQRGPGRVKRKKLPPVTGPIVERESVEFDAGLTLRRDEPALVVFTSGSGGEPKAAVLSAGNLCSAARYSNRAVGLAGRDRWLLSLPLHHVSGLSIVFRCLLASAAMVEAEEDESLLDVVTRHVPTHVSLVATQLYRLLRDNTAAAALARCKAVVMGGGPAPEPLVRDAAARGIKLVMSYGMTETAAMICCTRPGDPVERLLSSGKPLVDGTMSISPGGEILVRGDQLFLGYLQPDGSFSRPLTDDGWFPTGDLGRFDDAGYLHVTGRRDNMFISGGENIQPEEIERALRDIEGVEEAVVVPTENAEWGKRPAAFLRAAEGARPDFAGIERRLREVLPGYKIPRVFHPWPADLAQPGIKPARKDFEARAKEFPTDGYSSDNPNSATD